MSREPQAAASRASRAPLSARIGTGAAALASVLLWAAAVAGGLGSSSAPESLGEADVDNDPEDREAILSDEELPVGRYRAEDEDGDGDPDRIVIGVGGGARLVGWRDFDGLPPEVEIFVSDPTRPAGSLDQSDVDGDDDPDVLWVGAQGKDLDGDGEIEPEENGFVVGSGDLDGDGDPEIVVLDRTRRLGDYRLDGFGVNRAKADPHEVLWVGVLDERERGSVATIEAIFDEDGDGDDDVRVKDLRTSGSPGFGLQVIDVDGDGDGDIWIRSE